MLVRPIIAPTPICIMSLARGGIFILLFPIVSRSSMNEIIDITIPIVRMMISLFSRSGEKSAKRKIRGLIKRSVMRIDMPAPYGAGFLHFSLL